MPKATTLWPRAAPVPGTDWSLITENHWADLTASTRRYGSILLVVLVLGMLLPALGVVLLVRERNAQILDREREEQELRMAGLIQKNLLPKQVPVLPGWDLAVHYRPAAASGGDFYDFLFLPDGRLMLALGDIADRSIPATSRHRDDPRHLAQHCTADAASCGCHGRE